MTYRVYILSAAWRVKSLAVRPIELVFFCQSEKTWQIEFVVCRKVIEGCNKSIFYQRQLEVEWQIVFHDTSATKGKLCSSQGHLFEQLLLRDGARVTAFFAVVLLLLLLLLSFLSWFTFTLLSAAYIRWTWRTGDSDVCKRSIQHPFKHVLLLLYSCLINNYYLGCLYSQLLSLRRVMNSQAWQRDFLFCCF